MYKATRLYNSFSTVVIRGHISRIVRWSKYLDKSWRKSPSMGGYASALLQSPNIEKVDIHSDILAYNSVASSRNR